MNKRNRSLDQLTFRIALARQLIDGYSSRKRKGRPASLKAKIGEGLSFALNGANTAIDDINDLAGSTARGADNGINFLAGNKNGILGFCEYITFNFIIENPTKFLFRELDGWELDKKDFTLYYSCQEKAHHFGVGFIVNKRLRNTAIDFQAISMRLCKIRLRGRHYNTTLICAHAPTDGKDETEKDLFYDLLMKSYNSCPAQDMKLVIGDFNAEIGRELFISSNAGLHSLHKETNENGQRLWDFAVSENLFIISTAFPHKEIHKYTWISPDGQTHNQIDHVLIDRRHRNNIMDNVHTEQDIIADEENPTPSITEVTLAIKKLKNNRSTGPDSIPSELLKVDEPEHVNALHKIMVKIWETKKIPLNGNKALSAPFLKKETILNVVTIGELLIDQIHTLRQILEKTKEYNIKTFHLFVDFKAAYDSINRDKMIEAMTEFKIPKKFVNLTKATLKNVRCRIKVQKYLSEPFTTEKGLRQGDSLACLLFNLADDIGIIGRSEKAVKEAFQALEISATNMGLTINEDKTKFMETLPSSVNNTSFCVNGHSFERKQLRSKLISGKTKLRLYKTLILPVLLYASETWTLNLETMRALETFERKALRTIFGPVKDQGCWRTRYNFELYRLYKEPQVTQVIRSNRLRWLGHIWKSPENNQTRAYTFKNPMGSRTIGRPPTRWIDDVENDLKTLNILKTGRELLRIVRIGRRELWRQPRPVTGFYAYKEEVLL
ncbi:craniofacial development protein 2 [Trichonephila clavipes]|nr:craniofacial development protein 2 [Trichonephila clavipes]